MNLSISTRRELSLEPGLTMFVNDPLLNWLNKNNGKTLFSKSKSPTRSFFKLTYPKKFVRGKFCVKLLSRLNVVVRRSGQLMIVQLLTSLQFKI